MEQKQKKFVNTQIPMTQKSKKHNVLATSLMISLGVAFGLAGIFLLNQAGVTRAQQQDITEGPFITGHDNVIQYVKEINFYNEAQEIVATMSANQADGTLLISGVDGIALAQQNGSDLGKEVSASVIIGGKDNTVLATGGTILGGLNNKSKGLYSLIGGGKNNTIVGGRTGQIILGGENNYNDGGIILGSNNENGIFEEVQKITVQNGMLCSEAPDVTYNGITLKACNEGATYVGESGNLYRFDDPSVRCPVGYHIPSGDEWIKLILSLQLNPGGDWSNGGASRLSNTFFLPFIYDATHYHSSTTGFFEDRPDLGIRRLTIRMNHPNHEEYVGVAYYGSGSGGPDRLRPVRCFRDKDIILPEGISAAGVNNIIIGSNVSNIRLVEEVSDEEPPIVNGISRGIDKNNIGYITISDGTKTITIMDKNLGATVAGTGTDSYGHHYQRGRNVGFPHSANGEDAISLASVMGPQNRNTANSHTNFIKKGTPRGERLTPMNNDLRGGGEDAVENGFGSGTNGSGRQGPCPSGYHVPSVGEWDFLLQFRRSINSGDFPGILFGDLERLFSMIQPGGGGEKQYPQGPSNKFVGDFLLPLAGLRTPSGPAANILNRGSSAHYWSSSPSARTPGFRSFGIRSGYGIYMYISVGAVSSNAMSVRCFKDDPQYIPHHPPAIAIQTATSNSFIRSDGSLPKRTVGNKFIPQINKAFYINAQTGAGVNTNNPQTSLDSFGAVKLIHSRIGVCTSENAGEIGYIPGAGSNPGCFCACNGTYWTSLSNDPLCVQGCSEKVTPPICGNGIRELGEQCDLGSSYNGKPGYSCSKDCTIITGPICGNGIVEPGEDCDFGQNRNSTCSANCKRIPKTCGNGIKDPGETCENCPQDAGPCSKCGNGILDPGEDCDYGMINNAKSMYYCSPDCKRLPKPPVCGNGICEKGEDSTTCPKDCCRNEYRSATNIWEKMEYQRINNKWVKSDKCPDIIFDCNWAQYGFDYCFNIIFSNSLTKTSCDEESAVVNAANKMECIK